MVAIAHGCQDPVTPSPKSPNNLCLSSSSSQDFHPPVAVAVAHLPLCNVGGRPPHIVGRWGGSEGRVGDIAL